MKTNRINGYDKELIDRIVHSEIYKESSLLHCVKSEIGTSEIQNTRLLVETLIQSETSRLQLQKMYQKLLTQSNICYQVNIKHNKLDIKDFTEQYLCDPVDDGDTVNVCGDCIYFKNKCTTSKLEAKYGNRNTPAYSDFIRGSK